MKKYIKPITELHEIELQQMIADSPTTKPTVDSEETILPGGSESKEAAFSSTSLWDEEE